MYPFTQWQELLPAFICLNLPAQKDFLIFLLLIILQGASKRKAHVWGNYTAQSRRSKVNNTAIQKRLRRKWVRREIFMSSTAVQKKTNWLLGMSLGNCTLRNVFSGSASKYYCGQRHHENANAIVRTAKWKMCIVTCNTKTNNSDTKGAARYEYMLYNLYGRFMKFRVYTVRNISSTTVNYW
jgi:hypothetical protein